MSTHREDSEAFWFGAAGRRAFGWFHGPRTPARPTGVVLCPPLGHEMLFTHRAYRHLASRLADKGFPALRFDYHGTGDSPGSDFDPDRVSAWLASIDDAVATMRSSGVARVALFGMRMGATLAAVAAAKRGDVDALALVAPCASGSAYLREIRAMHKLRGHGEPPARFREQREGDDEAIGFVFRRETVEALAKVDVRALETAPAPVVLVVPRDDLPGAEERIASRLRAVGARVDVVPTAGYAAVATDDPYTSDVPTAIWTTVTDWLEALEPRADLVTRAGPRDRRVVLEDGVVESTMRYGADERFFAILSEPADDARDFAVVLANTGANSRVGPSRFGVKIARRVAGRGYAVMRVDLGGLGDSPAPPGASENDLFASRSIDEVRAAVDALVARGYRRFLVTGLCAGAYMAFHAGLADDRVTGVALMNPPAFEWRPGRKVERIANKPMRGYRSSRYYRGRALRLETWKRLLRGEVDARGIAALLAKRARERAASTLRRGALLVGKGDWVLSDLAQKFATLARRDTRVLLLFNGSEAMLDEVDHHLGAFMPWLAARGLTVEIIDDTDHTFLPVWSQERAIDLLTDFVVRVARAERSP